MALPALNPIDASLYCDSVQDCFEVPCWDCLSLRLGFLGDYVFNRNLETNSSAIKDAGIHKTSLYTNAGYFALNFFERVDFYGYLGTSHIFLQDFDAI